jgi:hypothetical protein
VARYGARCKLVYGLFGSMEKVWRPSPGAKYHPPFSFELLTRVVVRKRLEQTHTTTDDLCTAYARLYLANICVCPYHDGLWFDVAQILYQLEEGYPNAMHQGKSGGMASRQTNSRIQGVPIWRLPREARLVLSSPFIFSQATKPLDHGYRIRSKPLISGGDKMDAKQNLGRS